MSFHPGWSISSSGSNFVRRWLQLSKSLMCLGNQGPDQIGYEFCEPWISQWILFEKITFIEYLQSHNLQLLTLRLLQEVSLTAESELLLLSALIKWIKLVCLISILNIASTCALLLLLLTVALFVLYPFCIDSLVSIYAISPLWFYEW